MSIALNTLFYSLYVSIATCLEHWTFLKHLCHRKVYIICLPQKFHKRFSKICSLVSFFINNIFFIFFYILPLLFFYFIFYYTHSKFTIYHRSWWIYCLLAFQERKRECHLYCIYGRNACIFGFTIICPFHVNLCSLLSQFVEWFCSQLELRNCLIK